MEFFPDPARPWSNRQPDVIHLVRDRLDAMEQRMIRMEDTLETLARAAEKAAKAFDRLKVIVDDLDVEPY